MKGCGTVSPFELMTGAAFVMDGLEMNRVTRPGAPILKVAGSLARSGRS